VDVVHEFENAIRKREKRKAVDAFNALIGDHASLKSNVEEQIKVMGKINEKLHRLRYLVEQLTKESH